ncbi:MAG TPA: endolytic transglycosylase MltG [Flavipsychrobacter sp.]|nr:endolytic transglycosylase MltG [Flavipsychrobacter sp.]
MAQGKRRKKPSNGGTTKKIFLAIFIVLLIAGGYFAFKVFGPNTGSFGRGEFLYIHTGANYDQVKQTLEREHFVKDINAFDFLAKQAKYPTMIKAGKYRISKGMSNFEIIRMLRSGRQTPVKLVINKMRTKGDFIRYVASNLEADSLVLQQMLNDNVYLSQFGLDSNTAMVAIMPDTYEFWWNTTADKAYRKFEKYYAKFWTEERKAKAQQIGLSPVEVTILASILEEETNYNKEKPLIASVYINRLKHGMKLQADPTAKFASGNFALRRITSELTSFASPYNTYFTTGLPPGPICTPSKKSIEAVLNAPTTDYLYFCAKEDFSGAHRFAKTYEEHQKNAHLYQQALNNRGIH